MKLNRTRIVLLLILIIGAGLRFYRLPEMVNYDFDQEYAANFAYSVVKEFPIQMVGQGLSIQGLFMGPGYFYYLVPWFILSGMHPIGGYVGSVILGLIIIWAYYWLGSKLFNEKVGLIAAFIRAISFSAINADWSMVPSYSSVLMVLITWWLFYQIWLNKWKWLPVLGFVFGLYFSIHPILLPFYLVFVCLILIRKKFPSAKIALISLITFVLPILPLIAFEYFRKFAISKTIVTLVISSNGSFDYWPRLFKILKIISEAVNAVLQIPFEIVWINVLILTVVWLGFLFNNRFKNRGFHFWAMICTLVAFIGYYTLFPAHVSEYYLLAFTPIAVLYISGMLGYLALNKSLFKVLILLLILIYITRTNVIKLIDLKWRNPALITLHHKDAIVKKIIERQARNKKFFISYISEPGWNFGFDYLFKFYDRIPEKDPVKDHIYTIVIPKSLSPDSIDIDSGNVGLILPD